MKKKASQPASPQPRRPTHAALTFSKPQIFEPVPTLFARCSGGSVLSKKTSITSEAAMATATAAAEAAPDKRQATPPAGLVADGDGRPHAPPQAH